jgi:hypothetical protein
MAHVVTLQAQFNFDLGSKGHVSLSFEATNHFIIMDVKFGNVLPLRFIFDTGSEHTLLFKKEYADLLGIQYDRKIPLMGSDLSQEVYGYIARGVSLKIAGVYTSKTDILVLEEDYLKLEESTGVKIDGIIGANVFKYFVLTVNNRKNKIQFHQAEDYSHPKAFKEVPVLIYKNKPYIDTKMTISSEELSVRLLLDTGAGLPILLYTNTADYLRLPEKTIRGALGSGLGGQLEGYIGRVEHFSFHGFEFENVLSSFQEVQADSITRKGLERNGIIGNSVLSRFNYVIDYPRQKLYLKSRGRLKRKFNYDKSGIHLAAAGHNLKDFIIQRVQFNSPAHDEGLRKGDVIRKIEGIPVSFYTLTGLNNILSSRNGRVVKLLIDRDDKRIKVKITLRTII